jgi:hypothetical protein
MNAKVNEFISLTGMFSMGDWYYKGTATGDLYDETNQPLTPAGTSGATKLYLDNVKVGNYAQTTASLGLVLEPIKDLRISGDYRFVENLYGNINPLNFQTQAAGDLGALKLPAYYLVDFGASYKINLNTKQYFTIRANVNNLFDKVYSTFGLTYHAELSTRPEDSMGSDEVWEESENAIKEACKEKGLNAHCEIGEAAFYGPKLDFMVKDAIGRKWQLGTIQVDYNLPAR